MRNILSASLSTVSLILFVAISATAADQGSPDQKSPQAATPRITSPAQMVAAEKPEAAPTSNNPAKEEKKLVLPNASDYVYEGIGCGTAK